jgi:hypothetical protein
MDITASSSITAPWSGSGISRQTVAPRAAAAKSEGETNRGMVRRSSGTKQLLTALPLPKPRCEVDPVWRSPTGEALLVPGKNHRSKVGRITGQTGKSAEDERVAAGSVVATKLRNVRGAKGPRQSQSLQHKEGKDEMTKASIEIRHPRMGRLVQQSSLARTDRKSCPPRQKHVTMPKPTSAPWQRDSNQTAFGKPGAVHCQRIRLEGCATMDGLTP